MTIWERRKKYTGSNLVCSTFNTISALCKVYSSKYFVTVESTAGSRTVSHYIDWESLVSQREKWISSTKLPSRKSKWSLCVRSCEYTWCMPEPDLMCCRSSLHHYELCVQSGCDISWMIVSPLFSFPDWLSTRHSFGVPARELPEPALDWVAFSQRVHDLNNSTPMVWNPITKRMSKWVDMAALTRAYGPKMSWCSLSWGSES